MTSSRTQYTGLISPFLRDRRVAAARPHLTGRVLDIGCADGPLTAHVPADRYLGVDLARDAVEAARAAHPDHRFEVISELGSDEQFDTIAALAVIEHVPEPASWLSDLAILLAPGGSIVLTTPHATWEPMHDLGAKLRLTSREAQEEHETTFTRETLGAVIVEAGLRMVRYERFLARMNQLAIAQR